jgi:hypothetical protein
MTSANCPANHASTGNLRGKRFSNSSAKHESIHGAWLDCDQPYATRGWEKPGQA